MICLVHTSMFIVAHIEDKILSAYEWFEGYPKTF